jgi:hypothetical protein
MEVEADCRRRRLNRVGILKVVTDARAGCARLRRKCSAIAVRAAASDALRNSLSGLLEKVGEVRSRGDLSPSVPQRSVRLISPTRRNILRPAGKIVEGK